MECVESRGRVRERRQEQSRAGQAGAGQENGRTRSQLQRRRLCFCWLGSVCGCLVGDKVQEFEDWMSSTVQSLTRDNPMVCVLLARAHPLVARGPLDVSNFRRSEIGLL